MNWSLAIGYFAALFAIMNPLGNLPVFVAMTDGMRPGVRRWVAVLLGVFIAVALLVFLVSGSALLRFFSVSIPAFEVAGGVVLLLMGLKMITGAPHDSHALQAGRAKYKDALAEAEADFSNVLVPLGVPIFVGPGSMTTTIVYSSKALAGGGAAGWVEVGVLAGVVVVAAASITAVLMLSGLIARLIGEIGLTIGTRILGLIIASMAVQIMLGGLAQVTPSLFDTQALTPA